MPSTRLLYGTAAFLAAFLLFLIEPLAAKQLLPTLGGSSAVWLTCLVFFQTALLLGYLYAHWLTSGPRATDLAFQRRTHTLVITLALIALSLGIALGSGVRTATHPILTIFLTLTRTIGLPFFLLASTSPLLQLWLSHRESTPTGEPATVWYRLFALSNAGSLIALLAYPTLIEPHLALRTQRILWSAGFILAAILLHTVTVQPRPSIAAAPQNDEAPPTPSLHRWLWFLLPMAAAMQLSSVTAHITSNIAAIPLLWILPLAAYLLTFILAFDRPALYPRPLVIRVLVVMLAGLGYALSKTDFSLPIILTIAFFLLECFVACLFCHGETYALRPQRASEATLFYLLIAAGGASGTFLIAIALPLLFSADYDLALAFLATAALAIAATWRDGWPQRLLWTTATVLLFVLTLALHRTFARNSLARMRNFYGSLRVTQTDEPTHHVPIRTLLHGAIQHGTQIFSPDLSRTPTTYYATDSGIGLALRFCCNERDHDNPDPARPRNIGVIGLGAGTLAAYGRPGDRLRFYEINPQVAPIARNLFTYLRDSPAAITIVPGDARTSLAAELAADRAPDQSTARSADRLTNTPPQRFDVLVIDAFSGDAIPLHLLTTQALRLYLHRLTPTGILAFHVSNQYLDLPPQLALLAKSAHLEARNVITGSLDSRGEFRASWVLMTSDPTFFTQPEIATLADRITPRPNLRLWTDDYSSLLPILQPTGH
ncbi:spermidine synthase [Edaphobacter aggregans]|uniref:spermidine synthase n=1 Tax=Edaphobacter aggregans TaxID=570835 RepID=UPI00054D7CEB|nr:hypothetical protein [Edaphobacter aggregans]